MSLLALKLLLVPLLIAAVTLAGRRWGQNLAGWLGSFPIVAGPILLILAIENGNAFGARAAQMSLAGIAAAMVFYVAYARLAEGRSWAPTLVLSLLAWGVAVTGLQWLPQTLPFAALAALASLLAARFALGERGLVAVTSAIGAFRQALDGGGTVGRGDVYVPYPVGVALRQ